MPKFPFTGSYTEEGAKGLAKGGTARRKAVAKMAESALTGRTIVLMTPEEMDAALKRTLQYRAPGT